MAKARRILGRAQSIRKIRTVTKTMEMVSTARYRQVHKHVSDLRPYTDRATDMVADLIARANRQDEPGIDDPLVTGRPELKRDAMVVITSDRGLCGGHNAAVMRLAEQRLDQLQREGYDIRLHVVGKKGIAAAREAGLKPVEENAGFGDDPDFYAVAEYAEGFIDALRDGQIGGLEVAYTQYLSASSRKPAIAQLLPLNTLTPPHRAFAPEHPEPFEFLPSREAILAQLLPAMVRLRLYQCFADAAVCEQLARMASMRSATDNADDMIRNMMLKYNRTRQGNITNELAEIVGGSEHLRG